jgi:hypothetical protein
MAARTSRGPIDVTIKAELQNDARLADTETASRSKYRWSTEMVTRVMTWLTINPPTMASGSWRRNSRPLPVPGIEGRAPKVAAVMVIMIGGRGRPREGGVRRVAAAE